MQTGRGRERVMTKREEDQFYVVRKKAIPEVLLNVVEAKRLLESGRADTVQEAADAVGISRSSFYKYKEDIFLFHEKSQGKNYTFVLQMDDEPGILSDVLSVIARYHANVLTIHQAIPINRIALLTLSIDILPATGSPKTLFEDIEELPGIHYLKILGRE